MTLEQIRVAAQMAIDDLGPLQGGTASLSVDRYRCLAEFALAALAGLDEAERIAAFRRWVKSDIAEIRALIVWKMERP